MKTYPVTGMDLLVAKVAHSVHSTHNQRHNVCACLHPVLGVGADDSRKLNRVHEHPEWFSTLPEPVGCIDNQVVIV